MDISLYITPIISGLSLILSIINTIVIAKSNSVNFDVSISKISESCKDFQFATIDIINNSPKAIIIEDIHIIYDEIDYPANTSDDSGILTMPFPVLVQSTNYKKCTFMFEHNGNPEIRSGKAKIIFTTNRGKVSKKIILPVHCQSSSMSHFAK